MNWEIVAILGVAVLAFYSTWRCISRDIDRDRQRTDRMKQDARAKYLDSLTYWQDIVALEREIAAMDAEEMRTS